MAMESGSAAEILARALVEDRLVALVGSATSARHQDPKGRVHDGLPTANELVEIASNQFGYVSSEESFNRTFDLIHDREGRSAVEEFLLRYYKVPESFEVPPSHKFLAWLPFSIYITSNYDQFL